MQELVRLERVGVDDPTAAQIVPKSGEVGAVNTRIQEVSVVLIQQEFEPNGLVRWHPVALAIADPPVGSRLLLIDGKRRRPGLLRQTFGRGDLGQWITHPDGETSGHYRFAEPRLRILWIARERDVEQLYRTAVVASRPDLEAVLCTNCLRRNARAISGPAYTGFEFRADTGIIGNLSNISIAALVDRRRGAGWQIESRYFVELIDDLLCDAIAEVVLARIAGGIGRRHHGDRRGRFRPSHNVPTGRTSQRPEHAAGDDAQKRNHRQLRSADPLQPVHFHV